MNKKKVAVREGLEGVEDIISIMEEMINEISDKRKLEGIRFGVDKFQELRDKLK